MAAARIGVACMSGLEHLREVSKICKFKKGEMILREGDADGDAMYIILLGEAGVYRSRGSAEQVQLSHLKKGDFFGEMKVFLDTNRVASVMALTDITVLEIHRDNISELFSKMPSMAYTIIRTLCVRLHESNGKYAEMYAQLRGSKGLDAPVEMPVLIEDAPSATPVLLDVPEEEHAAAAPMPAAPASPAPAPKADEYPANPLFPPGHKRYILPGMEPDTTIVGTSPCVCPMCDHEFKAQKIRNSKLRLLSTDADLRSRFQGVDTLHYLTMTCPKCYFSAIRDNFTKAMSSRRMLVADKINPIKAAMKFDFDGAMTAETVFASMYLALQCVPLAYTGKELITARIWRHLSWMYRDCGDEAMEKMATLTAYEQYLKAYEVVDIPATSVQSICYIIGDLAYRVEDIRAAKRFFYSARTNRDGGALMRSQAEDRLAEIRAWEAEHPSQKEDN